MLYRLICSLLVVLVCVGGYVAFGNGSSTASQGSNQAQTDSAPAASSSSDDNNFKDLKVN